MKISEGLKSLLKVVPRKEFGICGNMARLGCISSVYIELKAGIRAWEGNLAVDCDYPVEGYRSLYDSNSNKWDRRTKFGKRSYELLNHLIKYYEGIGK